LRGISRSRRAEITLIQAIFLGIVQGLTEFFPVSSSGHLVFFQSLFGIKEPPIFFDVMLHVGTLLAVVVYLRREILQIIQGLGAALQGKSEGRDGLRMFLWMVIASIPTGLMGIVLKDWFESVFSQPRFVGYMVLVTGLILWLTRWVKREGKDIRKMRWLDALLIGIAQGVAILPGISRSGSTISAGLFLGLDRVLAGKFSFLLSIPAILGAALLESRKIGSAGDVGTILMGTAVAGVVGYFSLKILMKIISIGKVSHFSYYCWAMGVLMLLLAGS
jgi:undecaprenyl-diphosphatase